MACPKTVYDVRAFLGFVGYYRRFIKGFSKVALPLRNLLIGLVLVPIVEFHVKNNDS